MDIQLPVLDGYGATRQIKADTKHAAVPIIAVSSFAMRAMRKNRARNGEVSGFRQHMTPNTHQRKRAK